MQADRDIYKAKDKRLQRLADAWFNEQLPRREWPVLWHLAMRRFAPAMTELNRRIGWSHRPADSFSSCGLARRAYRLGDPTADYNLAMDHFNRGDLAGYRQWLRRAARAGDQYAGRQLRRFETRLPHRAARAIGRHRPYRDTD